MEAGDTREDTRLKRARAAELDTSAGQGGVAADTPVPEDEEDDPSKKKVRSEDLEVDVPIPATDQPTGLPSSSRDKRKSDAPADDDRGGKYQTVEVDDPDDPEEDEVGSLEVPEVLMLDQRRACAPVHPGKFEVCELFSPPRDSAAASSRGLRGGWALDIECVDPITGCMWDLSESRAQNKVWRMLPRDKPLVVGLSPACTLFSSLQNLRKTEILPADLGKAIACVRFCVEVAEFQLACGRFFNFEHPPTPTLWSMPEVDALRQLERVESVTCHMCAFGLTAEDKDGVGRVAKPTRILTNMPSFASAVDRRCNGGHRHVQLVNGRARGAAKYTEAFCDVIVDGVETYLQYIKLAESNGAFVVEEGELGNAEIEEYDERGIPFTFLPGSFCIDDVKGGTLPMQWVRGGRQAEMAGFAARRVYEVRPRSEAVAKGDRVVGVRWVDILKGDIKFAAGLWGKT